MTEARLVPSDSPLRRLRRLPKLIASKLCILLVENGYHVQRECREALTRMGHRVVTLQIGQHGSSSEPSVTLDTFLQAVVAHRPDMMLTIDCLAFDRCNWMGEVVDAVGLPTAVWYVDSPFFIGMGAMNPAPDLTTVFSWDRGYLPVLRAMGVKRVHHLPLATDLNMFSPSQRPGAKRYPMAFVGNTLTALEDRWRGRLDASEHALADRMRQRLLVDRSSMVDAAAGCGRPIDRYSITLAYANFGASKSYRLHILQALPQRRLHLFGDLSWRTLLPHAHSHAGFVYGPPLAEVFRQTQVNINATNLQMPCTVNQRVFDVPACGSLLLTDAQAELENYFIPGEEVLTYESPEEAAELAQAYSGRPERALPIVARARRRVAAEHTYDHRLRVLLEAMRQDHAHGYLHLNTPASISRARGDLAEAP